MIYLVWLKGNTALIATKVQAVCCIWDGTPSIRFYEDDEKQKLVAQFARESVAGVQHGDESRQVGS